MMATKRFTGFLIFQNRLLADFVRGGRASNLLGSEEADRLTHLSKLNAQEIARWERDLLDCV